ncbi:hypothetical protein [Legionella rowbothamii]|uniref:hypothetical protein n=1 Tax=Legionella rowbothamii TaxID=96229 RepID=UPI0010543177|nr:hypothetical protein [Legionella rowbothamii]
MKFIGKANDVTLELKELDISNTDKIQNLLNIAADEAIICAVNRSGLEGRTELYVCESMEDMQEFENKLNLGEVIEVRWYTAKKNPTPISKVDISGLDKGAILVALVNNAKTSRSVSYILSQFSSQDLKDSFTINEANELLKKNKRIDYVGPVGIKMNFEEDTLFVKEYDKRHCLPGSKCLSAYEVINKLRNDAQPAETILNQFSFLSLSNKTKTQKPDSTANTNEFGFKKGFLN